MKSVVYNTDYGTKEIKKSGLADGKIYNIMDAVAQLQMIIEKPERVQAILVFYAKPKYSKYGDIHMYSDGRPMEYIPVK
jgi:reverse gyrase